MGTYECLLQKTGYGTPSSTHTDDILQPDADGVYQVFPTNEPIWKGARCVLDGSAGTDVDAAYADNGSGVLLPTQPYLHDIPAATNQVMYSRFESTQTSDANNRWLRLNSCTVSRDQTGIDGVSNESTTVTWGASNSQVNQRFTIATGDTLTAVLWIKKTTSASTYPGLGLYRYGGTTSEYHSSGYIFNTDDGTYTGRPSHFGLLSSLEAELVGDYWKVIINHAYIYAHTSYYKYQLTINPSAATSAAPTTWDVSNSGSIIVGQVQAFRNITIADARRIGPVFNTGTSTVSIGASLNTWGSANHSNTEGGHYLEHKFSGGEEDILSLGGTPILYTEIVANGSDLVTNGDFASDLTGWTYNASHYQWSSGSLQKHGTGSEQHCYQTVTTEAGKKYEVEFTCSAYTATPVISIDGAYLAFSLAFNTTGITNTSDLATFPTTGTVKFTFIADGASTQVGVAGNAATLTLDDFTCKEVGTQLTLDEGTNTISNAITTGEHQIGIAWETDTSEMDLCLDGTWYGSSDAYDGSFGTGDLSTEATIRELQGVTGDLTTSKTAIDALMGGIEYIVNGDFTTDLSGWINPSTYWAWVAGRAYHAPTSTNYSLDQSFTAIGGTCTIAFDLEVTQGSCQFGYQNSSGSWVFPTAYAVGTHAVVMTVTTGCKMVRFYRKSTVVAGMYVDNVSVRSIPFLNGTFNTDLSYWTNTNTHWAWINGRAYHAASSSAQQLIQSFTTIPGSVTIKADLEVVQGRMNLGYKNAAGTLVWSNYGVGTHNIEISITAGIQEFQFFRQTGYTAEAYLDNIKII